MYLVDNPEINSILEESAEIEIPLLEESIVAPDMSGLLDILMESDANWYNIRESLLRSEIDAVLSEDVELIGTSKQSYFKKIIEALSNMASMIKDFMMKVMNAIVNNNKMVQVFLKKHKANLSKVTDEQLAGKQINVHEFNSDKFARLTKSDNVISGINEPSDVNSDSKLYSLDVIKTKILSQLNISSSSALFNSAIQKDIMGTQPVTKDLKAIDVLKAISFVETGYPTLVAYLNNRNSLVQTNLSAAIQKAKAAQNAQANDKAVYTKKIEFYRNRAKAIQMLTSVTFTLANKRYGESMRILRTASSLAKPLEDEVKDDVKEESLPKVSESTSIFDNFL